MQILSATDQQIFSLSTFKQQMSNKNILVRIDFAHFFSLLIKHRIGICEKVYFNNSTFFGN